MIISRILTLTLTVLILGWTATRAVTAQSYPNRPVRFIVPFPAGGGADVAARIVGEYLSHAIGQQVYTENRPGAGGVIGIEAAVKSLPDGYTVLLVSDFIASTPHVYKMNADPLKDLLSIRHYSRTRQPLQ